MDLKFPIAAATQIMGTSNPPHWGRIGMGATLGTRLMTWLRGELVGTDPEGNRSSRLKGDKPQRLGGGRFSRDRRWVIYNGEPEASKVPSEWHASLHHMSNEVPQARPHYPWERP